MTEIIRIDGSILEGGGAILRNSVSLSAIFQKPIEVYNIRANRPKPGLRNQHAFVIRTIAKMCGAETAGVEVGSQSIRFIPSKLRGGQYKIDVGTAGSLSLLLQAIFPVAALAPSPVKLFMSGGTDVKWSPPIDYIRYVYLPMMKKIGIEAAIDVGRRGHYPKGGGKVSCEISPVKEITPIQFKYDEPLKVRGICGRAHVIKLPSTILDRMIKAAVETLRKEKYEPEVIEEEHFPPEDRTHLGPGVGIVLWACNEFGTIIAGDALGERGIPAEKVGRTAAENLIQQIKVGRPIDYHLADQLIVWMGLSKHPSVIDTSKITLHTLTNIEIVQMLSNAKFTVEGKEGKPGIISCEPVNP